VNEYELIQGDCLEVMKEFPSQSIDFIFCDLPYGTTQNHWDVIIPFDQLWNQYNRLIKPDGAIVLTGSQPFTSLIVASNIKKFKTEWIWEKAIASGSLNAKRLPMKKHESVLVFAGPSGKTRYFPIMGEGKPYTTTATTFKTSNYGIQVRPPLVNDGTRYPTSIIEIANPRIAGGHPTQKPVALAEYFIKTYSKEGEIVMDNCMGSGSTGIAAIKNNRHFVGIERDTEIFQKAKENIEPELIEAVVF
jgi:site-specific DNA-methyltransferase (adenine-specific)